LQVYVQNNSFALAERKEVWVANVMDAEEPPNKRRPHPEWIAVKAFALAILLGTALLCLPLASRDGRWQDPLTALFTATSATCVTGLIVTDTAATFSGFGQLVILGLIQLGGLGIMTLGTFFLVLAGRRLSMNHEFVLTDALGHERHRGIKPLLLRAVGFTLLFETVGAAVLAWRFASEYGMRTPTAVYHSVFHSISAFCNAGFSLYEDSLMGLRTDKVVVLTVAALVVLGGIGFLVLYNLSSLKLWRRDRLVRGRLTLHSRVVLMSTAVLLAVGALLFLGLEWNVSLRSLTWPDKLCCSLFQSVTPRTAGFNVVDMAAVKPASRFLTVALMFIGGSPSSTAGGVKTTTLIVLILAVTAMIRGREETEVRHKAVPRRIVREALSIFLLSLLGVCAFFAIMLVTEQSTLLTRGPCSPDAILFEVVSAFATVGLSTGITAELTSLGKLCIIACMFIGRLGPLTMALIIGSRDVMQTLRYPEEEVVVG